MKMEFNESSILAEMNPQVLLCGILLIGITAFFCARKYRNTNDFKKSSKLYAVLMIPIFLVLLWIGLGIVLSAGVIIFGFIVMALVSNHYFHS